jgi:5-hydroxyisourate hydrolase-like protein (transthyretin family)
MLHLFTPRLSVAFAIIALCGSSLTLRAQDDSQHHARKYKAPPPAARIEVTVLRDSSGKPIQDAHVIFHPIEGDKDKGYLELKTNEDGKTVIDVIPIGDTVRMQVIANGFQTFGEDYKVDKAEMAREVRMKRPGGQYSIYNNSGNPAKSGDNSGSKPAENTPGKPADSNPPQHQTN